MVLKAWPASAPVDPASFQTSAKFAVDSDALSLATAVATIEPRLGASGYFWLRIYFYAYPVGAEDLSGIQKGDVGSMDKKWSKMSGNPKDYNASHATLQLSVDREHKVWQVDMAIPGHACTIAPFPKDVDGFLQEYRFDGNKLRLKSKGSYVCDMNFKGTANQKFAWDVDVTAEVFQKLKQ